MAHHSSLSHLVGKVVQQLPEGAYMESLPGQCDVFVPRTALNNFALPMSVGDTVLVHAEKFQQGQNQWRVLNIMSIVQPSANSGQPPQTGGTAGKMEAAQAGPVHQALVDSLVRLVHGHGGEMGAQKLSSLYQQHPGSQEVIRAAGGLKGFCARYPSLVRFVPDAGPGKVTLCPVVDTLVQLVKDRGGQLGGNMLADLYKLHPWAKDTILAAGGLKEFCIQHGGSHGLRFANHPGPGPGPGKVFLAGNAPSRQSALPESGGQGGPSVLSTLVQLLRRHGGELDGATVCAQLYAANPGARAAVRQVGGLKEFCMLHPATLSHAGGGVPGKFIVRLLGAGGSAAGSERAHASAGGAGFEAGEHAPPAHEAGRAGALQEQQTGPGCAVVSERVVDSLVQMVVRGGGEVAADAGTVASLYRANAAGLQEIREAGGLRGFCAQHPALLRYVGIGVGKVQLRRPAECLVQLLKEAGGAMREGELGRLYALHPRAEEEVTGAGGVAAFCEANGSRLRFEPAEGAEEGAGMISLVGGGEDAEEMGGPERRSDMVDYFVGLLEGEGGQGAGEEGPEGQGAGDEGRGGEDGAGEGGEASRGGSPATTPTTVATTPTTSPEAQADNHAKAGPPTQLVQLQGRVGRIGPTCAFMESSPGVQDVYVPGHALNAVRPPLAVGDEMHVQAALQHRGQNRYCVVTVLGVQRRPGAMSLPQSRHVHPRGEAAAAAARPSARLVGTVTKVLEYDAFMESRPGVSDVFIPGFILEQHALHLAVGQVLHVRAEAQNHGRSRFRCVEILGVTPGPGAAAGYGHAHYGAF